MKHIFKFIIFAAIVLAVLSLVKYYNIYYPVQLVTTNKSTELSVVGEGRIDVVPDTAYIDLGVTVDNVSAVDVAQKRISETNNKIVEAMKALGINKADIKTSNYSIYPNYVYEGSSNRITGYNGNVTITVKVTNPDKASQAIEKATEAGANQVQGTRFVVDNPAKYREEARRKAIDNAKEQAQKLASDLGITLGKIVNISESSPDTVSPVYAVKDISARSMGGGGGTAIEPGSQTITSVVTLYFEKR